MKAKTNELKIGDIIKIEHEGTECSAQVVMIRKIYDVETFEPVNVVCADVWVNETSYTSTKLPNGCEYDVIYREPEEIAHMQEGKHHFTAIYKGNFSGVFTHGASYHGYVDTDNLSYNVYAFGDKCNSRVCYNNREDFLRFFDLEDETLNHV